MAEDGLGASFQSIAKVATASWYAHRASTPNSKQSTSIGHDSTQIQTPTAAPESASASASVSASVPPSAQTPAGASVSAPSSTPTPTSSHRDSEVRASRDVSIRSDITAWQSALQSLPPEFSNAQQPAHPLAQALIDQPTLRPVQWNQYRQQGGFVPRTPHDYSSLMIYISGQVNPNPCRNCLLRNGPFAQCVVSPPAVLAISALRHACANCTYQNQYKKCTNEPISEHEKARSEMARPVIRAKNPILKPTIPRKPKTNSRTKRHHQKKQLELQQRLRAREQQLMHPLQGRENVSITQSPAGLGTTLESFDEKLRRIRGWSPCSRRRMAAEAIQWQAAIATVEAEEPAFSPDVSVPGPVNRVVRNNNILRVPPNSYTASQPIPASSATFAAPLLADRSPAEIGMTSYGAEHTYEPMDEDESESEQEGDYEGASWVGLDHSGPIIKTPR
ncbi:hypothetical protein HD806DRAFT_131692 [Xylariaceae sp. AK1471]|nr:hypothetical protein HD806DRAFT_131692 [Xylariaceae sp. AK1471]